MDSNNTGQFSRNRGSTPVVAREEVNSDNKTENGGLENNMCSQQQHRHRQNLKLSKLIMQQLVGL
jgi:hypothetical protein